MAFFASNILPEEGLNRSKKLALQVKNYLSVRENQFLSDTNADVVLATFNDLKRYRDEFLSYRDIPGIAQYARDQENDQTYDVVTEFNAMITAIEAVITNIYSSFPKDANNFLLEKKLLVDGTYEFRIFTGVQLSTLRGLITAAIAQVI